MGLWCKNDALLFYNIY